MNAHVKAAVIKTHDNICKCIHLIKFMTILWKR